MVYLPPHLCNWLGERVSDHLLRLTDRLAGSIPRLREQGGLLVFEIQKAGGRPGGAEAGAGETGVQRL
jgi:hypothetical protein